MFKMVYVFKHFWSIFKRNIRIYKTKKKLAKKQIKFYKMTKREIFEKYANLSQNELKTKNNIKVYT